MTLYCNCYVENCILVCLFLIRTTLLNVFVPLGFQMLPLDFLGIQ